MATNQFMDGAEEGLSEAELVLSSAFVLLGAQDRNLIGVRSPYRCNDSKGWDDTAKQRKHIQRWEPIKMYVRTQSHRFTTRAAPKSNRYSPSRVSASVGMKPRCLA